MERGFGRSGKFTLIKAGNQAVFAKSAESAFYLPGLSDSLLGEILHWTEVESQDFV